MLRRARDRDESNLTAVPTSGPRPELPEIKGQYDGECYIGLFDKQKEFIQLLRLLVVPVAILSCLLSREHSAHHVICNRVSRFRRQGYRVLRCGGVEIFDNKKNNYDLPTTTRYLPIRPPSPYQLFQLGHIAFLFIKYTFVGNPSRHFLRRCCRWWSLRLWTTGEIPASLVVGCAILKLFLSLLNPHSLE